MTLKQLLAKHEDDEQIITRLLDLYPDMEPSAEGFYKLLPDLRTRTPSKTGFIVVVEIVPANAEWEEEEYVHVCGEKPDETELYALDFTPWGEWLGMRVHPSSLITFDEIDILAHILWEMTWHGFDETEIQKEYTELIDRVSEIEDEHGSKANQE